MTEGGLPYDPIPQKKQQKKTPLARGPAKGTRPPKGHRGRLRCLRICLTKNNANCSLRIDTVSSWHCLHTSRITHTHTLLWKGLGCERALFAVKGERGRHVLRSLPSRGFPRVGAIPATFAPVGGKVYSHRRICSAATQSTALKNPRSKQTCPSKAREKATATDGDRKEILQRL